MSITSTLQNRLPAFKHKNYRLFWFGQTVSTTGTWMQSTAQAWLVYQLTNSPFLLGLIGALQFLPVMLFSLVAGVYLDRFPKREILLITQTISAVIALLLAILFFTDLISYWQIAILVTILGFVNTMDMPTRQSFMLEIVGREHLTSAIGMNSVTFNLARIVGPALGGILMAYYGAGICFLFNSISFIAVIISLYLIKTDRAKSFIKPTIKGSLKEEIIEGLRYVRGDKKLFIPLITLAVVATFAINFNVIIPVFAKTVLLVGSEGFGFLLSALGVGSIIGALTVAIKQEKLHKELLIKYMPYAICLILFATSFATNIYFAGLGLVVLGIVNLLFFNAVNSSLQLNADLKYRGRVMSIYTLVFGGTTPIGNLFAGYLTDHFGAKLALGGSALVVVAFLFIFSFVAKRK